MRSQPSPSLSEKPDSYNNTTKGVSVLTGDPKSAIRKLAGPMFIAMLLMTIYNIVDAFWVAGLGSDALAAVGFMTPLFMVLIGFGNGIGAGATSAISRRIGAKDKPGAELVASHSILIMLIISVVLTAAIVPNITAISLLLGAGDVAGLAADYGLVIFSGTVFVLFTNVVYGMLRAEGDTKRTMYAMAVSSVINIVLDPVLIYYLDLGVAGAALATVISIMFVTVILFYWIRIKKDTYVTVSFKNFRLKPAVIKDILGVGIPASTEFFLMSLLVITLNGILVSVSGTDAVAIYTTGWRVVMFAIIPQIAIGTSLVAVAGAAYGARLPGKLRIAYIYSLKLGFIIALATSLLTWIFAPQITLLFTYSPESAHIAPGMIAFLQVMCFFYIFVPPGMMTCSMFQGVGKGMTSLFLNFLRNLAFIAVIAWIFTYYLGMGQEGVWWGVVAGDMLGGVVALVLAMVYLRMLTRVEERINSESA